MVVRFPIVSALDLESGDGNRTTMSFGLIFIDALSLVYRSMALIVHYDTHLPLHLMFYRRLYGGAGSRQHRLYDDYKANSGSL